VLVLFYRLRANVTYLTNVSDAHHVGSSSRDVVLESRHVLLSTSVLSGVLSDMMGIRDGYGKHYIQVAESDWIVSASKMCRLDTSPQLPSAMRSVSTLRWPNTPTSGTKTWISSETQWSESAFSR
jgi:hypothetical protein